MTERVVAIIVARDESDVIEGTIQSLRDQTHPPEKVILIDDGSKDKTGSIAYRMGCSVKRYESLEVFGFRKRTGSPDLALRWNMGLELAETLKPDYILFIGADHKLPPNYIEELLRRMIENRIGSE